MPTGSIFWPICAECSVNAVKRRHERAETDRLSYADRLALALGLDTTLLPARAEGFEGRRRDRYQIRPQKKQFRPFRKATTH
jgi:hypothetical protein